MSFRNPGRFPWDGKVEATRPGGGDLELGVYNNGVLPLLEKGMWIVSGQETRVDRFHAGTSRDMEVVRFQVFRYQV